MQRAGIFFCGLVLGVACFALLDGLGAKPLALYDEGTYAAVVAESFARGDFLTFTYQAQVFFDKPPLYFWLAGIATSLAGDAALGIRLPAALAGIAVVGLAMLLAYALSKNMWTAAAAGALLLAIAPFIDAAREARLDVLAAAWILLAVYFALERRWAWFGIMLGLGVLSKSIIGAFALLPTLPHLRERSLWVGVAAAAAIAAPWHLYEWARHGTDFWASYVGHHVLGRYAANLFGDPALQSDYLARLGEQAPLALALFFAALAAAAMLWHSLGAAERRALIVPLGMVAAMAAVFFTAQTRALSYLVPLYPFAAVFVAAAGSLLFQRGRGKLRHEFLQNNRGNF